MGCCFCMFTITAGDNVNITANTTADVSMENNYTISDFS